MKRELTPPQRARRTLVAIIIFLVVLVVFGKLFFLWAGTAGEAGHRYMVYCLTPGMYRVQGQVVDEQGEPVPDALVYVRNLSAEKAICSDVAYLSEATVTSDVQGEFMIQKYGQPDQHIEIIITADGCKAYSFNTRFGSFDIGALPFVLDCDE